MLSLAGWETHVNRRVARPGTHRSMVSPSLIAASATAAGPSMLTDAPLKCADGYSPGREGPLPRSTSEVNATPARIQVSAV